MISEKQVEKELSARSIREADKERQHRRNRDVRHPAPYRGPLREKVAAYSPSWLDGLAELCAASINDAAEMDRLEEAKND